MPAVLVRRQRSAVSSVLMSFQVPEHNSTMPCCHNTLQVNGSSYCSVLYNILSRRPTVQL